MQNKTKIEVTWKVKSTLYNKYLNLNRGNFNFHSILDFAMHTFSQNAKN